MKHKPNTSAHVVNQWRRKHPLATGKARAVGPHLRRRSARGGNFTNPLNSRQQAIKLFMDKVIAAALIVLLSPLLLLIALAVKSQSSGPILFKQARHGRKNSVFYIYKFRSMECSELSETGVLQVERGDERTTRIGRFLRRTSLDELPQLLNVLQGNMSLIGPRPHPIPLDEEYEQLIDGYSSRYRAKPGITGWAQVNGLRGPVRSVSSMQARVDHDCFYADNWSPLFDIKILLLTLRRGFMDENAY
jgi:exopolysaccharide biosynthesis polyprenyl glycosylphosphotransferase